MNIALHTSEFHDGSIFSVDQTDDQLVIFMESAEIDSDEVRDILLTNDNRLRGKLHIEGIQNIKENGAQVFRFPIGDYKKSEIKHLKILNSKVILEILWTEVSDPTETGYSSLEIEADKVWWENRADLPNPFW